MATNRRSDILNDKTTLVNKIVKIKNLNGKKLKLSESEGKETRKREFS